MIFLEQCSKINGPFAQEKHHRDSWRAEWYEARVGIQWPSDVRERDGERAPKKRELSNL